MSDVTVDRTDGVAVVVMSRPPANYMDVALVRDLADALHDLGRNSCRAAVVTSAGKHFCAGVEFSVGAPNSERIASSQSLYREAHRLFQVPIPVIAAVHGAAVGGGLGLACAADFRVTVPSARFHANFSALGFHHGFGLTVTLPRLVGPQRAAELLYTASRINGADAAGIGLADRLVEGADPLPAAIEFAREIAASAPLTVREMKKTMVGGLVEAVAAATERELEVQAQQWGTEDCASGIAANLKREIPVFVGR